VGTLVLTEASTTRRASLHLVHGEAGVRALDPGGAEPLEIDAETFRAALRRENHTVKRTLTDPRILSGIGNAYSDEILWRAGLSPVRLTQAMTDEQLDRLHAATQTTLREWTERLARDTGHAFPEEVTAFREGMAVHGRGGQPCPRCGAPVQRIAYASNEANYCARCQNGGRLLADRALSRLMRGDWPKTIDQMEQLFSAAKISAAPSPREDTAASSETGSNEAAAAPSAAANRASSRSDATSSNQASAAPRGAPEESRRRSPATDPNGRGTRRRTTRKRR
jgi:formamidopyrimidine-DNA glycosylase